MKADSIGPAAERRAVQRTRRSGRFADAGIKDERYDHMRHPSKMPKLSDEAERLLRRLAEKQSKKYQDEIEINQPLLKELGFNTEEDLSNAVTSLNSHAHEHGGFWENEAPILYIEHNQLVPGPSIESAWSKYKAQQRM